MPDMKWSNPNQKVGRYIRTRKNTGFPKIAYLLLSWVLHIPGFAAFSILSPCYAGLLYPPPLKSRLVPPINGKFW